MSMRELLKLKCLWIFVGNTCTCLFRYSWIFFLSLIFLLTKENLVFNKCIYFKPYFHSILKDCQCSNKFSLKSEVRNGRNVVSLLPVINLTCVMVYILVMKALFKLELRWSVEMNDITCIRKGVTYKYYGRLEICEIRLCVFFLFCLFVLIKSRHLLTLAWQYHKGDILTS